MKKMVVIWLFIQNKLFRQKPKSWTIINLHLSFFNGRPPNYIAFHLLQGFYHFCIFKVITTIQKKLEAFNEELPDSFPPSTMEGVVNKIRDLRDKEHCSDLQKLLVPERMVSWPSNTHGKEPLCCVLAPKVCPGPL